MPQEEAINKAKAMDMGVAFPESDPYEDLLQSNSIL
jgi:hypothetical protein